MAVPGGAARWSDVPRRLAVVEVVVVLGPAAGQDDRCPPAEVDVEVPPDRPAHGGSDAAGHQRRRRPRCR